MDRIPLAFDLLPLLTAVSQFVSVHGFGEAFRRSGTSILWRARRAASPAARSSPGGIEALLLEDPKITAKRIGRLLEPKAGPIRPRRLRKYVASLRGELVRKGECGVECRCQTRICRPALTKRLMIRARTTRLRKSMRMALAPYPGSL